MSKVDTKFVLNGCQSPVCGIHQCVSKPIIRRSEPFILEYSPKAFHDVKMWAIRRKEEDERSSFFPNLAKFCHHPALVYFSVVKDNKRVSLNMERKSFQEVSYFIDRNTLHGSESVITVIPVNYFNRFRRIPF